MKSLLACRWLGQPVQFEVEGGGIYTWQATTLASMHKDWAGGGILLDFGSHMLDLLLALFEEPVEVLEYRDNSLGGIEADCSIRLQWCHQGDAVEVSVELARIRNIGSLIRIECERGMLEFQIGQRFRVRVIPHGVSLCDPLNHAIHPFWLNACWKNEKEDVSWYETFRTQIDDWLEAIRIGGEPGLSGRSSLSVARLVDTCYQRRERMDEPWVVAGFCQKQPSETIRASGQRGIATSPGNWWTRKVRSRGGACS